jgi:type I restriction enzyme, S subunit
LQPNRFLKIEVPLPAIGEQRQIISRLEQLSAKLEEARRLRRESIEEGKAVLISEWREVFEAAEAHGWRNLSIEDCCEAIIDYRGRTPPLAETGIPHLTSRNVKNGKIDWNTNKFVAPETYEKYMTRGIPRPGDVIFTMEAPLGEAAVVPDQRRFSLAQRTLLLRGRPEVVGGEFLARVIMSPQVHDEIYSKATGTTVKGIASKRLKHIPIPVPPLGEQLRIVAYLDDLQIKLGGLKKLQSETAAELDALMPSILSKAFRGEL